MPRWRRCSEYPRKPSSATGPLPKCGWHRPSNKSIRRCPFRATSFRVTSSRLVSERTDKLEAVFHAAAELSLAEQCASYLEEACRGDPTLRHEVEALLRAVPIA